MIMVVLVAAALGACVPAPPVEEPVVEEVVEPEPITLIVWDTFVLETENRVAEILNREFEEAHGVKIERVVKAGADLYAMTPLAMAEPGGPDIAQVNQGRPDMGAMVKAGLLLDLDPYAEKYGWTELFSPGMLARTMWTADGREFGTGNLYGVAGMVQNVGVHYHRDKFAELGLSIPETFDEFQAMLAKVKAAGVTPIAFGNLDRFPASHMYGSIQHPLVTAEYLDNFVYGRGNARFDIPENIEAARILQDWVRKGYFTEGFPGIGYDDTWKSFAAGDAMFLIAGNWLTADAAMAAGGLDRIGFFLVPPMEKGGRYLAIGGTDEAWSIRHDTKYPDLAAEYINWFVASPRAIDLYVEHGLLPKVPVDEARWPEGSVLRDAAAAYLILTRDEGVGHYIEWAATGFGDVLYAQLEELLALRITPEEFVVPPQEHYAKFLQELEKEA
jgi:raffinose/stachyose/melibiose transport system substrate-binding protein